MEAGVGDSSLGVTVELMQKTAIADVAWMTRGSFVLAETTKVKVVNYCIHFLNRTRTCNK